VLEKGVAVTYETSNQREIALQLVSASEQPLREISMAVKGFYTGLGQQAEILESGAKFGGDISYREEHLSAPDRLKLAEIRRAAAQFRNETHAYEMRLSRVLELLTLATHDVQALFAGTSATVESIDAFAEHVKQL
jgi:hypothetical protein